MSKLEKVIMPCNKKYATIEELTLSCGGVFPVWLVDNFEQPIYEKIGFLATSMTKNCAQLNLCLFKKCEGGKLEIVQRFALSHPRIAQLKSMMVEKK